MSQSFILEVTKKLIHPRNLKIRKESIVTAPHSHTIKVIRHQKAYIGNRTAKNTIYTRSPEEKLYLQSLFTCKQFLLDIKTAEELHSNHKKNALKLT